MCLIAGKQEELLTPVLVTYKLIAAEEWMCAAEPAGFPESRGHSESSAQSVRLAELSLFGAQIVYLAFLFPPSLADSKQPSYT